jgi:hypothetical protein
MPFDTNTYIFYALIAIVVLLIVWIVRLEYLLKKMLHGRGETLDESIAAIKKDIAYLRKYKEVSEEYIEKMDERLRKSITGVKTVRFNPFKGTGSGGNQSFATAFVSENGDGVVLSSLYSREHISIFSKPLEKFGSEYELSAEEKNVLAEAKATVVKE